MRSFLAICALGLWVTSAFASGPDFISSATTLNQNSVATVLDNIAPGATGSLLSTINSLASGTPGQQQTSFNQLSGEMFGNTQTLGLQVGDQFLQRVGSRLISNGHFLAGTSTNESVGGADYTPISNLESNNAWMQGYGVGGSLISDGNGAGMRYSQGGGVYGFDLGADDTGRIGIAGGNSYAGFHDGFGGFGQLNAYQIGIYGLKHNEVGYVLGSTNYGYDSFGSTRNVSIGGIDQSMQGSFAGQQFGAYAESGLKYHFGWFHIQPLVGLQYLYFAQQSFGETGGSAALNVSGSQASSLRTHLGGRLVVDQMTGPFGEVWTPYWQLRWVSELLNTDRSVNAAFAGAAAGGTFTSHGTQLGQNYLIFGKGLQVQLNEQWSLFGNIDLMTDGRIHTEMAALGAVFSW